MFKLCHILKANKASGRPDRMVFFDCETGTVSDTPKGKEQKLILYTALYYRYQPGRQKDQIVRTHGRTDIDLVSFILNYSMRNVCLYVFSANIWFDLRVSNMFKLLLSAGYSVKWYYVGSTLFLMKMTNDRRSLMFINIQNIFPVPVKKIGQLVGLPKLDCDFKNASFDQLLTYCTRDTEIIFRAMLFWFDFIVKHDLGCFGSTLASQAFNAYRHRFMTAPIAIHNNEKVSALERRGYFGGRTECFFIGKVKGKRIHILDINSMYPYVMKTNKFPYRLKYYSTSVQPANLYGLLRHYCCVATCCLKTNMPVYAKKHEGKTIFPTGQFITTLNTGGFLHAYEHGHVVSVLCASLYSAGPIFAKWVKEIYALRQTYMLKDDKVMVFMIKRLLNSLYGKFGQKSDEVVSETNVSEIDFWTEYYIDHNDMQWYTVTHFGDMVKVARQKVNESFNSFPAISAHVTEYARLYLWKMLRIAGLANVFYTDTDSLYVNDTGLYNLKPYIHKTRLGALKHEGTAKHFHIFGLKDYQLDGKIVIKGIPKKAEKLMIWFNIWIDLLTSPFLLLALFMTNSTYKCDMFPGMKRDLQGGMSENYMIETRTKTLKREYNKGRVLISGVVVPLSLQES